MSIFSKIKSWFGAGEAEKPRAAAAAAAAAADFPLEVVEPIRALQKRASQLSVELFQSLGFQKLSAFVREQTDDNLLSGTRVTDTGALDFSVAEARFFKLPEQWLKLVEKFLQQLIDELERLEAGAPASEPRIAQKAVITVTPQARAMISSIGMGELVTRGAITGIETELVPKEGVAKPVSVTASALKDEAGNIQGMVIAAKDLSEVQKLQKENLAILEKAKDEAEELVKKRTGELQATVQRLEASEQQLKAGSQQLEAANQQLAAAQKQLQDKIVELERFNKITMGREVRILGLKEEVARLKGEKQKSSSDGAGDRPPVEQKPSVIQKKPKTE